MQMRCAASALVIRSLPEIGSGTDTGKRMFKDQIVQVYGHSLDKKWAYVDAPAARGWVSLAYLEDLSQLIILPSASWPKVPTGLAEIKRIFGEPGKPICGAGRVVLPELIKLSWSPQLVSVVACHKLMEDVFTSAFKQIHARGLWKELENFGGIYNDRTVTQSQKISTHAWGIAGDFDTLDNALGRRPKMHPLIIKIFEDHGFVWGGNWNRPDGMHFQYARGY